MTVRADDDLDPEVAERMRLVGAVQKKEAEHIVESFGKLIDRWGKRLLTLGGAAVLLGAIATFLGFSWTSDQERIDALRRALATADSALATRVGEVEAAHTETNARLARLEQQDEFQLYLTCTVLRTVNPNAVPRQCSGTSPIPGTGR